MVINEDLISRLVKENGSRGVNFGTVDTGVSDFWIKKAEERLGTRLPPSYVWFLRTFGGGEIFGDEIFSIYENDDYDISSGDIIYHFLKDQKARRLKSDEIAVLKSEHGIIYLFKVSERNEQGEYPIYSKTAREYSLYARSFIEFLSLVSGC